LTGCVPNYIPELEKMAWVDDSIVAISDIWWNTITIGNTKKVVSAQSLIKILLYAYALEQWIPWYVISNNEAVWLPFNQDPVVSGNKKTAWHPLNNAGGISSASHIKDRDEFVWFVRICTNNPDINILQDIYLSEKKHRENNLKLSASLASAWRYSAARIEEVLEYYTKSCSLGVTVDDVLHIWKILMSWWVDQTGNRILQHDTCVFVINAMNTFGLYDESNRINLMVAWTKTLAAKSSVSGLILWVNPYVSTYVTLGHHLDWVWNSVFWIQCAKELNVLLNPSNALRLDTETQHKLFEHYLSETELFTKHTVIHRIQERNYCKQSCLLSQEEIQELFNDIHTTQKDIEMYIESCFLDT
jgi:glutaminase